jgi:prophage maintenance system killer protein
MRQPVRFNALQRGVQSKTIAVGLLNQRDRQRQQRRLHKVQNLYSYQEKRDIFSIMKWQGDELNNRPAE